MNADNHTMICGVPVARVSHDGLASLMVADCEALRSGAAAPSRTIVSLNAHSLSLAAKDPSYLALLRSADLVHADGQFIVWVSKGLTDAAIPERTCTTDIFERTAALAAQRGYSFYLLGGSEAINRACAEEMTRRHPALRIAGRRNGYFDDPDAVIDAIAAARPDIVWVGLGKPIEQVFAARAKERLRCAWIITCGGCFHYMVGDYPRAPVWMQDAGLEWAHRLATGPRKLMGRYLATMPHAVAEVARRHMIDPAIANLRQRLAGR